MATITLSNVLFYKAGVSGYSKIVGRESSSNRVARYKFTSPSTGASGISISIPTIGLQAGSHIPIRFYITTSSSSHANAGSGSTYTGTLSRSGNTFSATVDFLLLPSTTYYLWVFPGSSDYGYYGWASTSASAKLTTSGAAKSVITGSGGTLGQKNTLTLTRYASDLNHTISAVCGGASMTIAEGLQEDSLEWIPPVAWSLQNVTGTTVAVTVKCETYTGDTKIGETTVTLTFKIPTSVVPTVSLKVSDAQGYLSVYGGYVQTKSKAAVDVTAAGAHGSTIKSYSVKCGTLTGEKANVVFDLPNSGEITVSATVMDSRGREATAALTIEVVAYSPPSASITDRYRCDAEGNEDPDGEYAAAVFDAIITSLDGKNSASYALKYRIRGTDGWSTVALDKLEGNYTPKGVAAIVSADADKGYELSIEATDNFTSIMSAYRTIQVAFAMFQANRDIKALGFGQRATVENTAAFGLAVQLNTGWAADQYDGATDSDETTLNTWLDSHLDGMSDSSIKLLEIQCKPVAAGNLLYGFLCRQDAESAVLFAWSGAGALYLKVKSEGVWSSTSSK